MLDHLQVTPARLADAADAVLAAADAIDEILAQLDQEANALRSRWSGEAQLAFDAAQRRLAAALESRTAAATTISTTLKTLAEGYSTLDLESARALGVAS